MQLLVRSFSLRPHWDYSTNQGDEFNVQVCLYVYNMLLTTTPSFTSLFQLISGLFSCLYCILVLSLMQVLNCKCSYHVLKCCNYRVAARLWALLLSNCFLVAVHSDRHSAIRITIYMRNVSLNSLTSRLNNRSWLLLVHKLCTLHACRTDHRCSAYWNKYNI